MDKNRWTKFCPGSSDGWVDHAHQNLPWKDAPRQTHLSKTPRRNQEIWGWHVLGQEIEHGIRIVRVGDPHVTGGDSRKRLEQEVYQDPDSDLYLYSSEKVYRDDSGVKTFDEPFATKGKSQDLPSTVQTRDKLLAIIWCVKMEDVLNSHLRGMKTFLKARYRLSDLLKWPHDK